MNITNRADEAYWSGGIISSLFAYPDNLMRDHRKVAFYDVTEADPYSGRAVYTGMGVGQQYLGPTWEDRSIRVEGPMLVELKRAVRELLLSQGMPVRDIPLPLQARNRSVGYDSLLAAGSAPGELRCPRTAADQWNRVPAQAAQRGKGAALLPDAGTGR